MAKLELKKKPKNPVIVEGFPGFGLIGTITTEYLLDHLKTEKIGRILVEDTQAMVAIHEKQLVEPMGIFYNKEYNLVILHALVASSGTEWQIADAIKDLADELDAKEIISIEGVGSNIDSDQSRTFFFSNRESKIEGVESLKEGIIMGVTSALLLKAEEYPVTCVFAETHSKLPDSKAAANVVRVLDSYLGLKIDPEPLMETAKKFEEKLKSIIQSSNEASKLKDSKQLSYVG